jgi:hypothetical protein
MYRQIKDVIDAEAISEGDLLIVSENNPKDSILERQANLMRFQVSAVDRNMGQVSLITPFDDIPDGPIYAGGRPIKPMFFEEPMVKTYQNLVAEGSWWYNL